MKLETDDERELWRDAVTAAPEELDDEGNPITDPGAAAEYADAIVEEYRKRIKP